MSEETNEDVILRRATALVELARECGFVLTIETQPRKPVAMGYYDMIVGVRPARRLHHTVVEHVPADDTEGGAA